MWHHENALATGRALDIEDMLSAREVVDVAGTRFNQADIEQVGARVQAQRLKLQAHLVPPRREAGDALVEGYAEAGAVRAVAFEYADARRYARKLLAAFHFQFDGPGFAMLQRACLGPAAVQQTHTLDRCLAAPPAPQAIRVHRLDLAALVLALRVEPDRPVGRSINHYAPLLKPDRALAELTHGTEVVGDEDDGPTGALEVGDSIETALLERCVADGEDLVDEDDIRVDMDGDGEAQAHVHTA